MKKGIKSLIIAAVVFTLSATFAFAGTIGTVEISGQHKIDNEQIKTGRHTFVLTAEGNSPMPEGSENGVKKVTISSGETFSFGTIEYEHPGTYEYTVSRELHKSKNLVEDDTTYKAKVAVFSDGTSVLVFDKIGTVGKPNKIEYTDTYVAPDDGHGGRVPLPKTGDTTQIMIYILPLLAAFGILLFLLAKKKKDN